MAVLTHIEQCVWHAYNSHADDKGIAWVGPSTIAKYAGHASASHIRRARVQLVANGLLVRVDGGGGRMAGKFRVEAPEGIPDTLRGIGARSESALGPKPRRHPAPNRSRQPAPNPPMHPAPNRRTEVLSEVPKQTNNNSSAAVVGFSLEEGGREDKAMAAMRKHRIVGKTPQMLIAEVPGLTASIVNQLAKTMSPGAGTGILVNIIKADGPRMVKEAATRKRLQTEELPRLKQKYEDACKMVSGYEQEQRDLVVKATGAAKTWVASLDDPAIEAMLKKEARFNRYVTPRMDPDFIRSFRSEVQHFVIEWWKREKKDESAPITARNEELKTLIGRGCLAVSNASIEVNQIETAAAMAAIEQNEPNERGFIAKTGAELEAILPNYDATAPTKAQAAEFWAQNYTPTEAEVDAAEIIRPNQIQEVTN